MRWLFQVITMYDQSIKLISIEANDDEYGDTVAKTVEREVFAEIKSVGQSEFYKAQALGLKPEIKLVLPDYMEYQGERLLKFKAFNETEEQEYSVIRTYRAGNELEIVCKRGVE